MIKFVEGDFFDYQADIRVNTVNCVGVMGAGVALQFKNMYPVMFEDYVKACNAKTLKIGLPHVWQDVFSEDKTKIINFPTKDDWKKPSKYEYIDEGLKWLRNYLLQNKGNTITIPALGCGHGGLDWVIVKEMICKYLTDIQMNILVFAPESSNKKKDFSQELKDKGIEKFHFNEVNHLFPDNLSKPIYIKGHKEFLDLKKISIIVDSKANEKEKNAVLECINMLPDNYVYVLGYGNSFETDILKHALSRNLKVLIVLPLGMLEMKIRKDLLPHWNDKQISILSLVEPKQTWKSYESTKALKFRFNVSDAILIANFDFQSLENFENELKNSKKNIFYINYWKEGISFFQNISAKQIGRNKETLRPNLGPLLESLQQK